MITSIRNGNPKGLTDPKSHVIGTRTGIHSYVNDNRVTWHYLIKHIPIAERWDSVKEPHSAMGVMGPFVSIFIFFFSSQIHERNVT